MSAEGVAAMERRVVAAVNPRRPRRQRGGQASYLPCPV
jgi:hypothetical protein